MTLRLAILSAILLSTVGAFAQRPSQETVRRGYEIGIGDKIAGRVLGEDEFNFDSVVDEDGKIQVPFAEEGIVARCKTEKELRAEVARHLQKFLKNPLLNVTVTEKNRQPVTVVGEVVSQQRVTINRPATLLEVVSFTGGLKPDASGSIRVTRTMALGCSEPAEDNWMAVDSEGISFPARTFSFKQLAKNNPKIYPGDIIEVQKSDPVYVVGEVIRPGAVAMPEEGLLLTRAIALTSGTYPSAKLKEVKVYRQKDDGAQPEVIVVDAEAIKKGTTPDFKLRPFDIVEIGKSRKSVGQVLLEIASGGVGATVNALPNRTLY